MGVGYIGIALKPLENSETDLRMCLPHKRPSVRLGAWSWRKFTHRLAVVLTQSLVCTLPVVGALVALLAWKPLSPYGELSSSPLCTRVFKCSLVLKSCQIGAFWVSSVLFFVLPSLLSGRKPAHGFTIQVYFTLILSFDCALNFIPWNHNVAWIISHLRTQI